MQTSSTISVRTSVGRSKSPGIVEFENSDGMGPVGVEAADTNQVGSTLIAARRAPSFSRVKFNLEVTAQTKSRYGSLVAPGCFFSFCLILTRQSACCTISSRHRSWLIPRLARCRLIVQFPLHLAAVAPNLACRLAARLANACTCRLGRAAQWKPCYLAASERRPAAGTLGEAHPCGS